MPACYPVKACGYVQGVAAQQALSSQSAPWVLLRCCMLTRVMYAQAARQQLPHAHDLQPAPSWLRPCCGTSCAMHACCHDRNPGSQSVFDTCALVARLLHPHLAHPAPLWTGGLETLEVETELAWGRLRSLGCRRERARSQNLCACAFSAPVAMSREPRLAARESTRFLEKQNTTIGSICLQWGKRPQCTRTAGHDKTQEW